MNETLEQDTLEETIESQDTEELVEKYNLIFDNNNEDNNENENNADLIDELSENEECTALVTVKERRLMAAQTMFKKSIKLSIKSFLISLSLSFLNLFI